MSQKGLKGSQLKQTSSPGPTYRAIDRVSSEVSDLEQQVVPAGGTTGQLLRKQSNTDYDYEWQTVVGTGAVDSVNTQIGNVQLDAIHIPYNNTSSGMAAEDLQEAVDELDSRLDTAESEASTALQPGDNVSDLINDAGYLTAAPVTSVNAKTGVVVLDKSDIGLGSVDNVSAANLRNRTTHTGTQDIGTITSDTSKFLGTNSSGVGQPITNWSRNPQGGVDVNQSSNPEDQGTISIVHNRFEMTLDPIENITDSYYQFSDIMNLAGTFNTGNIYQKETYLTHSSTGTIGNITSYNIGTNQSRGNSSNVTNINMSMELGDSTNASSSNSAFGINSYINVTDEHTNISQINTLNATINVAENAVVDFVTGVNFGGNLSGQFDGSTGFSFNQGVTSTGVSTGYINVISANPSIDGDLEGFTGFSIFGYGTSAPNQFQGITIQPNFSGTNMQAYTGLSINHNMSEMINFNGIFISPTNGFTCTNFSGILINPNMDEVSNYCSGLKIEPVIGMVKYLDVIYADATQATVYPGVQASVTIQDLTFEWNTPDQNANNYTIEYTTGGIAGSESVSIIGTDITVQIEDGVSTADQIKAAMELIMQINTVMTITVSGVGSNPQTAVSPQSFTGGDWAGQARAAYFKGNVQIDGALSFSGALSIGALNAFSQIELVSSPPFPTSIHSLISAVVAENGTTYTAADTIGVNTACLMSFEANSTVTAGFLGVAALALPAVVATHTGSNVERVSGAAFAISLDAGSTGGTIETVSLCRSVAIPNGITTVDRLIGYEFSLPFGDPGTETWGLYMNPATPNWMAGSLKIGGTAGSTDKPQNSSVGIELEDKALLFAAMDTTARDALTALNGMVIYNTDTDKLQVRAAATWIDLH